VVRFRKREISPVRRGFDEKDGVMNVPVTHTLIRSTLKPWGATEVVVVEEEVETPQSPRASLRWVAVQMIYQYLI